MSAASKAGSRPILRVVAGSLAAALAVIILYGAIDASPVKALPWFRAQDDSVLHLLAFAALAVPLVFMMSGLAALTLASAGAVLVEGVQTLVPGREAALSDALAGVAGAFLVIGGAEVIRRARARRQ